MKKTIIKAGPYAIAAVLGIGRVLAANSIVNPIGSDTFQALLVKVTGWLVVFAIPIVSLMILYGGFQIMTAAGDSGKVETGKKTITYAIWGLVAVLLSQGASDVIKQILDTNAPTS
jgi:hypothetical protein